jgi:serine/threonine-protein kinase RsbW
MRACVDHVLELRVRAVPEAIPALRRAAVDAFVRGGGMEAGRADVALAVSEACTNTVRHAYPDVGAGWIDLTAWVEDDLFIVQVRDRGVGSTLPSRNPGARLGVALMQQIADAQLAQREGGGTETRMAFPLTGRSAGAAPAANVCDAVRREHNAAIAAARS